MGTAFAMLLMLTGVIALMGRLFGPGHRQASEEGISASPGGAPDARDKALAAVVAVSAVLGKRGSSGSPGGMGHSHGTAAPESSPSSQG